MNIDKLLLSNNYFIYNLFYTDLKNFLQNELYLNNDISRFNNFTKYMRHIDDNLSISNDNILYVNYLDIDFIKNLLKGSLNINNIINSLNKLYNLITLTNDNKIKLLYELLKNKQNTSENEINSRIDELYKYIISIYEVIYDDTKKMENIKNNSELFINSLRLISIIKIKLDDILKSNKIDIENNTNNYAEKIEILYKNDKNVLKDILKVFNYDKDIELSELKNHIINILNMYFNILKIEPNIDNFIENLDSNIDEYFKLQEILFNMENINNKFIKFYNKINISESFKDILNEFILFYNEIINLDMISLSIENLIELEINNLNIQNKIHILIKMVEVDHNKLSKIDLLNKKISYEKEIEMNIKKLKNIRNELKIINESINTNKLSIMIFNNNIKNESYNDLKDKIIEEMKNNKEFDGNLYDYILNINEINKIYEYELYENIYEENINITENQKELLNDILKFFNYDYKISFDYLNREKVNEIIKNFKKVCNLLKYIINDDIYYEKIQKMEDNINSQFNINEINNNQIINMVKSYKEKYNIKINEDKIYDMFNKLKINYDHKKFNIIEIFYSKKKLINFLINFDEKYELPEKKDGKYFLLFLLLFDFKIINCGNINIVEYPLDWYNRMLNNKYIMFSNQYYLDDFDINLIKNKFKNIFNKYVVYINENNDIINNKKENFDNQLFEDKLL